MLPWNVQNILCLVSVLGDCSLKDALSSKVGHGKSTERINFSKSFENLELCILPYLPPSRRNSVFISFHEYIFPSHHVQFQVWNLLYVFKSWKQIQLDNTLLLKISYETFQWKYLIKLVLFDIIQILLNWSLLELNYFVTVQIKYKQFTDPFLPDTYIGWKDVFSPGIGFYYHQNFVLVWTVFK